MSTCGRQRVPQQEQRRLNCSCAFLFWWWDHLRRDVGGSSKSCVNHWDRPAQHSTASTWARLSAIFTALLALSICGSRSSAMPRPWRLNRLYIVLPVGTSFAETTIIPSDVIE